MPSLTEIIPVLAESAFFRSAVAIAGVALGAALAYRLSVTGIQRFCQRVLRRRIQETEARERRLQTLVNIFRSIVAVTIVVIAAIMMLAEAGVAIGPLLAGAGVAGVAVGFGAQYLVRDLIAGIFTLLENEYRVGDIVCISEKCGTVEDITLRSVTLRSLDGALHYIPHGDISVISNLSKEYGGIRLTIPVAYDSDIEHVITVVNRVGEEMARDEYWAPKITEPPGFLRVDKFGDSALHVIVLGKTKPLEHPAVRGEYLKRIKIAFDEEGIIMPYPRQVVFHREYPDDMPL